MATWRHIWTLGVLLIAAILTSSTCTAQYQPNWNSLDARPLPAWYDEAKFGIFIHWGVFSVPSFQSEWFWWNWQGEKNPAAVKFMQDNYRPDFTYPDFGPMFTTEFYNPDQWASILQASGAKYVVLVSKHHEGFTNWPSKYSWNWNAMDVGPKRDLVGELAAAVRNKTDMHFGLYHSLFEWFHPLYLQDKANKYTTQEYVEKVSMPELMEIVNMYKPEVIWSDGDWEAPDTYWNSTEFLAWLYNSSPVKDTVAVNDRWGSNTRCKHGGFYNCNDKYDPGVLVKHKWENAMTIDRYSWGYRRNAQLADYLDMDALLQLMAETVSCNGNLLMNIGPTHDGRIVPIFEDRLRAVGAWLNVNGDAIYETRPWRAQNDTITKGIWYTSKMVSNVLNVYAIVLDWPTNNTVVMGAPRATTQTTVHLMGYGPPLKFAAHTTEKGMNVTLPQLSPAEMPCKYAWVLKMQYVE